MTNNNSEPRYTITDKGPAALAGNVELPPLPLAVLEGLEQREQLFAEMTALPSKYQAAGFGLGEFVEDFTSAMYDSSDNCGQVKPEAWEELKDMVMETIASLGLK